MNDMMIRQHVDRVVGGGAGQEQIWCELDSDDAWQGTDQMLGR